MLKLSEMPSLGDLYASILLARHPQEELKSASQIDLKRANEFSDIAVLRNREQQLHGFTAIVISIFPVRSGSRTQTTPQVPNELPCW